MDTNLINDISWKNMTKKKLSRDWVTSKLFNQTIMEDYPTVGYAMGIDTGPTVEQFRRRQQPIFGTPFLEPAFRDLYQNMVLGQTWAATTATATTATWLNNLDV